MARDKKSEKTSKNMKNVPKMQIYWNWRLCMQHTLISIPIEREKKIGESPNLLQRELHVTQCKKIQEFSASQILREINYGKCGTTAQCNDEIFTLILEIFREIYSVFRNFFCKNFAFTKFLSEIDPESIVENTKFYCHDFVKISVAENF